MLLDHFHSPLADIRPWTGFHGMWAGNLAKAITPQLPQGWFASPTIQWNIEVDVATFKPSHFERVATIGNRNIAIPEPTGTIAFAFTTDVVEVQVFHELGDLILAGAVEFVSPANKDRPENREAFVAKCDALLRNKVGVAIVDIVTERRANLHAELLRHWDEPIDEEKRELYLAAYRPFIGSSGPALSFWYHALSLGASIPNVLLFLKDGPIVELPMEETYRQTCIDLRIDAP